MRKMRKQIKKYSIHYNYIKALEKVCGVLKLKESFVLEHETSEIHVISHNTRFLMNFRNSLIQMPY